MAPANPSPELAPQGNGAARNGAADHGRQGNCTAAQPRRPPAAGRGKRGLRRNETAEKLEKLKSSAGARQLIGGGKVPALYFISPTQGKLTIEEMTENLRAYLEEDERFTYKIIIGTDSHTTQHHTMYVTALIIHRLGKGARFYFRRIKKRPVLDLRHRIYQETQYSLELIGLLQRSGIDELLARWPVEIHIDIGRQGETKQLIQEVVGWVSSVGFVAKIKPESYGASSVADRFTN